MKSILLLLLSVTMYSFCYCQNDTSTLESRVSTLEKKVQALEKQPQTSVNDLFVNLEVVKPFLYEKETGGKYKKKSGKESTTTIIQEVFLLILDKNIQYAYIKTTTNNFILNKSVLIDKIKNEYLQCKGCSDGNIYLKLDEIISIVIQKGNGSYHGYVSLTPIRNRSLVKPL